MIADITLDHDEIKKALMRYVRSKGYTVASIEKHSIHPCSIKFTEDNQMPGGFHYSAKVWVECGEKGEINEI